MLLLCIPHGLVIKCGKWMFLIYPSMLFMFSESDIRMLLEEVISGTSPFWGCSWAILDLVWWGLKVTWNLKSGVKRNLQLSYLPWNLLCLGVNNWKTGKGKNKVRDFQEHVSRVLHNTEEDCLSLPQHTGPGASEPYYVGFPQLWG